MKLFADKRKIGLYVLVSIVSAALAQVGLAVSFGLWKWSVVASVAFSLVVSAIPAFILSDLVIWRRETGGGGVWKRAGSFFAIAMLGSGISVVVIWFSVRTATLFNFSHTELTLVANVSSLATTVIVWFARFFVLNHFVYGLMNNRSEPTLSE